jgi:hypothetical protein
MSAPVTAGQCGEPDLFSASADDHASRIDVLRINKKWGTSKHSGVTIMLSVVETAKNN